ncbi:unnamed protein product [Caenorhabditis bovis]|uniref:Uncharacterized protein n=1 Tax=Caenorhabditis bovis TaxID=2654633 RepID=A0A8S1EL89_9PELO|nr:unnamed protein product [Caenorhabditis bovis]
MCNLNDYLTPGVISKFRPYRKIFIGISIIAIFFAVLIVVENIVFLSIICKQNALLLMLPYILSWILIILGGCFAKFAYILHTNDFKQFSSVLPQATNGWVSESRPVSPAPVSQVYYYCYE